MQQLLQQKQTAAVQHTYGGSELSGQDDTTILMENAWGPLAEQLRPLCSSLPPSRGNKMLPLPKQGVNSYGKAGSEPCMQWKCAPTRAQPSLLFQPRSKPTGIYIPGVV